MNYFTIQVSPKRGYFFLWGGSLLARGPIDLLDKSKKPASIMWYLAWPAIVEQILMTMVQYVDTAMVGSLGKVASAAVGLNTSTIWLINGINTAVGIGFSVQVARFIGSKENERAKQVVRQAVLAIGMVGIVLTCFLQLIAGHLPYWLGAEEAVIPHAISYMRYIGAGYLFNVAVLVSSNILRCTGDTKTPMFFNILTNLLNVVGNFLLIFPTRELTLFGTTFTMWGAGWGVSGAAISTALATAFSGIVLVSALFWKKSPAQISLRGDYSLDKKVMRDACIIGTPSALERITLSSGQIALTALITGVGTAALAAHQLAITAESLTYLPANGFSVAATTLVAQALGSGEKEMAFQYGKLCTQYAVAMMTITAAIMFALAPQLMGLFTPDQEVIALGAQVLRVIAFAEPFFALSIVIFGVLRGAGDTKWPFYISIVGMWGVRISAAFIMVNIWQIGLIGAWIAMLLDLVIRGAVCVHRFYKGNWRQVWSIT